MTRTACAALALVSMLAFDPAAFAQAAPDPAAPAPQSGPSAAAPDTAPEPADTSKGDTVYVFGRSTQEIGTAQSASEGIVGDADFETRPLLRPGELVEVIPGMIAAQHSGGGKANQYFLRGFNLDHGTDFAGSIDGVPLNLRAHPHMNGYLDLNFLIPEVVKQVEFHKGTSYAQNGDFSAAASADFTTFDRMDRNFAEVDASNDQEYRLLAAGSMDVGDTGALLGALETEFGDGAFDNPAAQRKYAGYFKYSSDWGNARFHTALMGYSNDWHATDQMPERAVQSGMIGRFGTLDPYLGGKTSRYILSAGLDWDNASLLVYGESYRFRLFNDPTFYLDQVHGDQFEQITNRSALGARGQIRHTFNLGAVPVDTRLGGDIRGDFIDKDGLNLTQQRVTYQVIRDDSGTVTLGDVWGDATFHFTDKLRATVGGREDVVWLNFNAIQPENSGSKSESKFSPKASVAYTFTPHLEGYASYGYAFHTNDPRGALLHTDPNTGDPVTPAKVFAASHGGETGLRYQPSSSFNVTAAVFELNSDSELIFSGDAGTSEPSGATQRYGFETSGFWQPTNWLTLDASGAWSHARFTDVPKTEDRIPNALDFVGSAGATVTLMGGWEGSLRARYLGKSALIEDNSVRSDPSFIMNLGVSKDFGPFYIGVDVLNLTNSKDNEIEYYYTSQLQGEAAPVDDLFVHPLEPRSVRLVLRKNF